MIFSFEDYDPFRNHDIIANILSKDPPGQTRDVSIRGGGLFSYQVIDRHDYVLNGTPYPCVHFTERFRIQKGNGGMDYSTDLWVDPRNGVIFAVRGHEYVQAVSIAEAKLVH